MKMSKQKIKNTVIKIAQFLFNPRFLLCFGIAWLITNGWSYILFGIGTYFQIGWMIAVATAYLAFLWIPFSPEKIVTVGIAMVLLRFFFPNDKKTLGILRTLHAKAKGKRRNKRAKKESAMKIKKNRAILFIIIAAVLIGGAIWTVWGNSALMLSKFTVTGSNIPKNFDGYRIAQISDLHNTEFGEENEKLIEILQKAEPDIITITGDLIDSSKTDIKVAIAFAEEAVQIAPTYFITGNHEAMVSAQEYADLENGLLEAGVNVLHDKEIALEKNEEKLLLVGIDDPAYAERHGDVGISIASETINELFTTDGYRILLSHRPEFFKQYVEAEVDLVLSGHAHGGQFRLPFIGGLVAPGQGLFPVYDSGLYSENKTNMVVSRGIGNSIIPMRFNNRPEVVLIELRRE